jgi:hypothetical protein
MSEREDVEVLIDALDAGFHERWGTDPISGDDRRAVAEIIAPWLDTHVEAVRVSERVRLAGEVEALARARAEGTLAERERIDDALGRAGIDTDAPGPIRAAVPVPGVRLTEEE